MNAPKQAQHTRGPKFVEVRTSNWLAIHAERDALRTANAELVAIIRRYLRAADPGASERKDDLANIDADARAAIAKVAA